eukprot:scaffold1588_cov107-Skeletonema_dohrnii-CCMP3373.AAC.1
MAWDPKGSRSTGGKSGKGQAGLFECVIEPIAFVYTGDYCDYAPDEPPTKKEFDKYVWKPYMKACGGFWSDVFYLVACLMLGVQCRGLPYTAQRIYGALSHALVVVVA